MDHLETSIWVSSGQRHLVSSFRFVSIDLNLVREAERVSQLVPCLEFPLRADSQSAVHCLVLATLATELAVCVAKQLT